MRERVASQSSLPRRRLGEGGRRRGLVLGVTLIAGKAIMIK